MESVAEATSGAIGSLLSTTILYPLDTCKTKYQAEVRSHNLQKYRLVPFLYTSLSLLPYLFMFNFGMFCFIFVIIIFICYALDLVASFRAPQLISLPARGGSDSCPPEILQLSCHTRPGKLPVEPGVLNTVVAGQRVVNLAEKWLGEFWRGLGLCWS